MKKLVLITILFFRTQAFSSRFNSGNNVISDYLNDDFEFSEAQAKPVLPAPPLEETRKFKVALAACYGALLSVFGGVVYYSIVLEPRFPF